MELGYAGSGSGNTSASSEPALRPAGSEFVPVPATALSQVFDRLSIMNFGPTATRATFQERIASSRKVLIIRTTDRSTSIPTIEPWESVLGLRWRFAWELRPDPASPSKTICLRQMEPLGLHQGCCRWHNVDLFEWFALDERFRNAPAHPCNRNAPRRCEEFRNRILWRCSRQFAMFNTVLDSSQVTQIMMQDSAIPALQPIVYYKLDEGSGGTITNSAYSMPNSNVIGVPVWHTISAKDLPNNFATSSFRPSFLAPNFTVLQLPTPATAQITAIATPTTPSPITRIS